MEHIVSSLRIWMFFAWPALCSQGVKNNFRYSFDDKHKGFLDRLHAYGTTHSNSKRRFLNSTTSSPILGFVEYFRYFLYSPLFLFNMVPEPKTTNRLYICNVVIFCCIFIWNFRYFWSFLRWQWKKNYPSNFLFFLQNTISCNILTIHSKMQELFTIVWVSFHYNWILVQLCNIDKIKTKIIWCPQMLVRTTNKLNTVWFHSLAKNVLGCICLDVWKLIILWFWHMIGWG